MINTRITYTRKCDNVPVEGVLVRKFTHTNDGETKDIALIYYKELVETIDDELKERPVFRYVEVSNNRLKIYENEKSIYEAENMLNLVDKYTPEYCFIKEYYIEDWTYCFVNYDW